MSGRPAGTLWDRPAGRRQEQAHMKQSASRRWIIGLAGAATLLGAGCASAPAGDPFQPEVVEPTRAVMYIYREPRGFGGKVVQVTINQQPAGELRPGQYMAKVVMPGSYLVRVEAESSMVRGVQLNGGDVAYLQIMGNAKPTIEVPESDVARRAIARTTRAGQ